MTFKEKVQSLSAKEIIMAMVEGLKNPVTEINMGTFGTVHRGVCFGCASTNTICKIGNYTTADLKKCNVIHDIDRGCLTGEPDFVDRFECVIDYLRQGDVENYNNWIINYEINIAPIKEKPGLYLPELDDFYTSEDLEPYIELANYQES